MSYISPRFYTIPRLYATPKPIATSIDHIQLLMKPVHLAVYHPLFVSQLPLVTVTTSIGHGRELLYLAKIHTVNAKYSGQNDSFMLNLANL